MEDETVVIHLAQSHYFLEMLGLNSIVLFLAPLLIITT